MSHANTSVCSAANELARLLLAIPPGRRGAMMQSVASVRLATQAQTRETNVGVHTRCDSERRDSPRGSNPQSRRRKSFSQNNLAILNVSWQRCGSGTKARTVSF